jgi:polar amino acid transport system substrate-binding protein
VPAKADVMEELAPTGKLRVAIAVAPAPSALYAIKDEATGKYRGVTVELGSTIAKKLGVPVEFVPHLASGEIQNSADANRWDVTFMPVDANEKNSSTSAMPITCCKAPMLQSTYLVAPGAKPAKIEDVNESGVRVGGVANTATLRPRPRRPLSQCRVSTPPSPL